MRALVPNMCRAVTYGVWFRRWRAAENFIELAAPHKDFHDFHTNSHFICKTSIQNVHSEQRARGPYAPEQTSTQPTIPGLFQFYDYCY